MDMGWKNWRNEFVRIGRTSLSQKSYQTPDQLVRRATTGHIERVIEIPSREVYVEGGQQVEITTHASGPPPRSELARTDLLPLDLQSDFRLTEQWRAFDDESRRYSGPTSNSKPVPIATIGAVGPTNSATTPTPPAPPTPPEKLKKEPPARKPKVPEPLFLTAREAALLERNMLNEDRKPPLVSEVQNLRELRNEYWGSASYHIVWDKVNSLREHAWRGIRRVAGDGDCFYRSLAFVYLSRVLSARDPNLAVGMALSNVQRCVELIRKAKLDRLLGGDNPGHRAFRSLLQQMITPDRHRRLLNSQKLLHAMQDRETSNAIVKFFRAITSAEIHLNPGDYKGFFDVEDERMFPDYTCQAQVETCGVEADHPQIHALTSALQLRIQIAELTLHNNRPVSYTSMPTGKDEENWENGIHDLVLLFRPGHYDILERDSQESYQY